ncbi:outer membrane beta-barrel protein [candidate division KSB1 bacterium]|nr:outer membrane beta-barrel protein [candidate division KSB1 bacterium]
MKLFRIAVLLFLSSVISVVAGPRGVYFGGSLGQSFIKTEVQDIQDVDFKLDDNDFAYKFQMGVRMSDTFAIEGGYKHLGTIRDKVNDLTFESKLTGYDLCAVGNMYLIFADVFAKAGGLWWDRENVVLDEKQTEGDVAFMWGFGATLRLGSLGVRAEWERFELPDYEKLSMLSLGLLFGF